MTNQTLRQTLRVPRLLPVCLLLFSCSTPGSAGPSSDATDPYLAGVESWHSGRIQRLQRDDGWLTLVGLFALPPGTSTLGTDEGADLRIQANGPGRIGQLDVDGMDVVFTPEPGANVTVGETSAGNTRLASDVSGDPTILESGSLLFYLLERHGRPYLRVKDREAPLLRDFEGIERWPVERRWAVQARWVEYDTPRKRMLPDVLGVAEEIDSPGELRFSIDGRDFVLYPNSISGDELEFMFGDATNGVESYGGGRFVDTDLPDENGHVLLDFNRAYNPPCVFTPFATCPLPAEGNTLDLEITAGEKMFGENHTVDR